MGAAHPATNIRYPLRPRKVTAVNSSRFASSHPSTRSRGRRIIAAIASAVAALWVIGLVVAPPAAADSHSVTLYVADAVTGIPIAGVSVSLVPVDPNDGVAPVYGTTFDSGTYFFGNVPIDDYHLYVSKSGLESLDRTIVVNDSDPAHQQVYQAFELRHVTSSVHGLVLDGSGNPVSYPIVGARDTNPDTDDPDVSPGSDGSYSIQLPPGTYDLLAAAYGYVTQHRTVVLADSTDLAENFVLVPQPTQLVSGTVTDATTHLPIADIEGLIDQAVLTDDSYQYAAQFVTDAAGHFSVPVPIANGYTIEYFDDAADFGGTHRNPAYETLFLGGSPVRSGAATFDLTAGHDVSGEDIQLALGGSISGNVSVLEADGTVGHSWEGSSTIPPQVYGFFGGTWQLMDVPSQEVGGSAPGDYEIRGFPAGQYRAEFTDSFGGVRSFATVYYNGQDTFADATDFTVTSGGYTTGIDAEIVDFAPVADAFALSDGDFGAGLQNRISVADPDIRIGDNVRVMIGTSYAGQWVSAWMHSTPIQLGGWEQVAGDGSITVPIPSSVALGAHDLDVQTADNRPLGWTAVTVHLPFPALTSISAPFISGQLAVGRTLTAHAGHWKPANPHFNFQWSADGIPVPGGAAAKYVLTPADLGKEISVSVIASKKGYSAGFNGAKSPTPVASGKLKAATPTVVGKRVVGSTLTASPGTWRPVSTRFSYQWLRDGKAIAKETAPSYVLTKSDVGYKITVQVTGVATGYTSITKVSSGKVAKTLP